jgi:hypothetical protein
MRRCMMKPVFLGLATVAALALPATHVLAGACGGGPINTPDAVASHVVIDLYAGTSQPQGTDVLSFAEQQFDSGLSAALPVPALKDAWMAFQGTSGNLKQLGSLSDASQGDMTVVTVPVTFTQGSGVIQVTVNPDLTVAGLAFLPASQAS